MYNKIKKTKNKMIVAIVVLIIVVTIITLCVQTISKNNLTNKSIIAGREIAKNEATQTLDTIDWIEDIDSRIGFITIKNKGK